jgi:hypothetical protein
MRYRHFHATQTVDPEEKWPELTRRGFDHLLHQEGAYVSPRSYAAKYRDIDRETKRKFRKLKRMAEKQGIKVETLLLRRHGRRRLETFRRMAANGACMEWKDHGYSYCCEILRVYKKNRTRYVELKVVGYTKVHYWHISSYPPRQEPLPKGTTFSELMRRIPDWRLSPAYIPDPQPLSELAQRWLDHCADCRDKDPAGGDPTMEARMLETWQDGVKAWTQWIADHQET